MKLKRGFASILKQNFWVKIFSIAVLCSFAVYTSAATWLDSLPKKHISDYNGLGITSNSADFYTINDMYTFTFDGGDNYYHLEDKAFVEGKTEYGSSFNPFSYSIGMKADDGSEIRLLYKQTNVTANHPAGIMFTGFTVKKDGKYREFYNQLVKEGTGDEFADEFGNADEDHDTGFVHKGYYKDGDSSMHESTTQMLSQALGVTFTRDDNQKINLAAKRDLEDQRSKFREDWNARLSQIATNGGYKDPSDARDLLYKALMWNNLGIPVTPAMQAELDKFAGLSGVTKVDGKVMSTQRAGDIARTNSEANRAAAINAQQNQLNKQDNNGQCFYGTFSIDVDNCIEHVLYFILGVFAWMLGLAAGLFGWVFNWTVVEMSQFINNLGAISVVWKVFRDFTNILFIFILLYLAISTILGMNEHGVKHTLSKLILVAVLINFSMFFAKAIVDASNILAISFYQKVNPAAKENALTSVDLKKTDYLTYDPNGGIAGIFMSSFNLQKLYKGESETAAQGFAMSPNTGTMFVMGTITMFLVTCMFLAATIIFINRLKTLMVLIMTSSLAFAGLLLHKTEGMAHQWWEKLLKEAFYAPIFMAIIWMALIVMTDPDFLKVGPQQGDSVFSIASVVNYIIVINFFLMALVVGEKMGASGASGAMKGYKWLKANVGGRAIQAGLVRPVGKAAYRWYEGKDKNGVSHGVHGRFKQWMEASMAGKNGKVADVAASIAKSALSGMVNAKVGAGASQKEDFQAKQHAMMEFMAEVKDNPKAQAEFLASMNARTKKDLNIKIGFQKLVEDMKPEELAEILTQLEQTVDKGKNAKGTPEEIKAAKEAALQAQETITHINQRMTAAQSDSIDRKKEGALPFHKQKFDELSNSGDTAALREFVRGLNPTQQAGLTNKQKTDDRILGFLSSKALVQMEGSTNDEQQERIAQTIDRRIKRMQTRGKAQADSSKESRRSILREVMQYKQSIGHEDFKGKTKEQIDQMYADVDDDTKVDDMHKKAKDAMTYYDQNMLKGDGAIAQNGRNLARTYGASKLGSDGEKIRQEFDKQIRAGQVEVGKVGTPKERAAKAETLRAERAAAAQARAKRAAEKAAQDAALARPVDTSSWT